MRLWWERARKHGVIPPAIGLVWMFLHYFQYDWTMGFHYLSLLVYLSSPYRLLGLLRFGLGFCPYSYSSELRRWFAFPIEHVGGNALAQEKCTWFDSMRAATRSVRSISFYATCLFFVWLLLALRLDCHWLSAVVRHLDLQFWFSLRFLAFEFRMLWFVFRVLWFQIELHWAPFERCTKLSVESWSCFHRFQCSEPRESSALQKSYCRLWVPCVWGLVCSQVLAVFSVSPIPNAKLVTRSACRGLLLRSRRGNAHPRNRILNAVAKYFKSVAKRNPRKQISPSVWCGRKPSSGPATHSIGSWSGPKMFFKQGMFSCTPLGNMDQYGLLLGRQMQSRRGATAETLMR